MNYTSPFQQINEIETTLKMQIQDMEKYLDEFCNNFVKTQDDIQTLSALTFMLNEMYDDLDEILISKQVMFN